MNVINEIKKHKIVAVIREANIENIIPIARALHSGGIYTLEITAETPRVTSLIEKVVDVFGDQLVIGAGTVLDDVTAREVIMAGAQFIVSPTTNAKTIKMAKRYGVVSIPGALTPTEILTAYEHGADMIKIFPANVYGPDYIKSIHGPFPYIPLMVTGGINISNMNDYILKGGVAVGIGGNLVSPSRLKSESDYLALTEEALKYKEKLKEC